MVSNPNEAAATETSVLRDTTDVKMNSANLTPPASESSNDVVKVPMEVTIFVDGTDQKEDIANKGDEEATATESESLNEVSGDMNSVHVTKLMEDVGQNEAAELNISMIDDDDDDENNNAEKEGEEEYDELLHNFDGFDLYRLDYEAAHENEDEGVENLQSPVPKSKQSIQASWPIAAGGEVLKPGDHVYMWCTMYQHHGIVLRTESTSDPPYLLIAEFTNLALAQANTWVVSTSAASGATVGSGATGAFRFVKETETTKWHKMKYQANRLECVTWRPGTCSAAKPSNAQHILLRVQFLHDCRHLLPEYHLLSSNCESVAIWCVTGKWETLQYHQTVKWSQGASMGLLAVAPGIGGLAAGFAFWHANQTRGQWKDTEQKLNDNFKWYALGTTPKWSFQESPP